MDYVIKLPKEGKEDMKAERDRKKLYSMKDCRLAISQELLEFRS